MKRKQPTLAQKIRNGVMIGIILLMIVSLLLADLSTLFM